jgi:hypothetical protein
LEPAHYRIQGRDVQPLDIVSFEHCDKVDDPFQPENVAISDIEWQLTGCLRPSEAYAALSPHLVEGPMLLGNRGAAVPAEEAARGVEASLALIEPREVIFSLRHPYEGKSASRPRVSFSLNGRDYHRLLGSPTLDEGGLR